MRRCVGLLIGVVMVVGVAPAADPVGAIQIGARLFADARFDQRYETTIKDTFVSCRACHVSEVRLSAEGALRFSSDHGFGDLRALSPTPAREDGRERSVRHSQGLVDGLGLDASGRPALLHWDGEFVDLESLVAATFTGRNFGWLPAERDRAVSHFARVVRADREAGSEWLVAGERMSYAALFAGQRNAFVGAPRLPADWRMDVAEEGDEAVLAMAARYVAAFLRSLQVPDDGEAPHHDSPYDAFLVLNRLPQAAAAGESPARYARRLHDLVAALAAPQWFDGEGEFGPLEMEGMRIFFRGAIGYVRSARAGNCVECHVPSSFTDRRFHNNGASQDGYDAVHGAGAFARLVIPELEERRLQPGLWLPPSAREPEAVGRFRLPPLSTDPDVVDLGLWNVYANEAIPAPQALIEAQLNASGTLSPEAVLVKAVARFKTPGLRNLGRSAPYLHDGRLSSVEDVLRFYQRMSDAAHAGNLRNAPTEYDAMQLADEDIAPLAAFLRSLNDRRK